MPEEMPRGEKDAPLNLGPSDGGFDPEIREFPRRLFPDQFYVLYAGLARSAPELFDQDFQSVAAAFGQDFDPAVAAVSHPAGQAETMGFQSGKPAEGNALDIAADKRMQSFVQTASIVEGGFGAIL